MEILPYFLSVSGFLLSLCLGASLFAVAMLATEDAALNEKLQAFRKAQTDKVLAMKLPEV